LKLSTLKLCPPLIAITAQHSAVGLILPPFLQERQFSVALIGTLLSVAPVLALSARVPSGVIYRNNWSRTLITLALFITGACNLLYMIVSHPLAFAVVHSLYGFAFGAVTTFYMAFFIESVPAEENRHHAMGYYSSSLASGHMVGAFAGGFIADQMGYTGSFQFASALSLVSAGLLVFLSTPRSSGEAHTVQKRPSSISLRGLFAVMVEPRAAAVAVVAMFLNLIHQIASTFLPLYGLSVGLTLGELGIIKGFYSLANAVTRPVAGYIVKGIGLERVYRVGLPLNALSLMLIPLFHGVLALIIVFLIVGLLRAIVIVANTISLVEDVDETRVPRGVASGISNASGDVGNMVGPVTGGLVASVTGIAGLFLTTPAFVLALFLLSLWGIKMLPTNKASKSHAEVG
jgi:MFS transporter, DHA1 family, multidrug resistance protein